MSIKELEGEHEVKISFQVQRALIPKEGENTSLEIFIYMLTDKFTCWVLKVWLKLVYVLIVNRLLFQVDLQKDTEFTSDSLVGIVTKLKSSARGARGLCFALCSQLEEPVPSTERVTTMVQSWFHRKYGESQQHVHKSGYTGTWLVAASQIWFIAISG